MASSFSEPSPADLRTLRSTVRAKSSSGLCAADQDDIAAEMALDAWRAAEKRHAPFGGLAARAAKRSRYYTAAHLDIATHRSGSELNEFAGAASPIIGNPLENAGLTPRPGVRRTAVMTSGDLEYIEVMDLINHLPDNWREAFVLVRWFGFTLQEAAEELGRPFQTIDRWVQRAVEALSEAYAFALAA